MMRPLDPEVRQLLDHLQESGNPGFAGLPAEEIRTRMSSLRDAMPPASEVELVDDRTIPGSGGEIRIRRFQLDATPSPGSVLYFHGGGWVGGSIEMSDALCRELAIASECDVFSVDYRLAPENPFPAAVEDADAALQWMLERTAPEGRVVLVGDSAGGNLAAVAARHARDRGASARIALQVLVYPIIDQGMETGSYREHVSGLVLNAPDMRWFWDLYAPDPKARLSPDASPLRAEDLSGLPPAFVLVTELDPLRDEGLAYARRLIEAGVEVTVDDYEGMIHGFFPMVGLLAAASRAVETVGAVIAEAMIGAAGGTAAESPGG